MLEEGYRIDFLVENEVVLEIKSVDEISSITSKRGTVPDFITVFGSATNGTTTTGMGAMFITFPITTTTTDMGTAMGVGVGMAGADTGVVRKMICSEKMVLSKMSPIIEGYLCCTHG
jgi:hypothetical protein